MRAAAELREGFFVVDGAELMPPDDLSWFDTDLVHPTVKASRAIADAVAASIQGNP